MARGNVFIIIAMAVSIALHCAPAFAEEPADMADLVGQWTPPDMDAVIDIRDCGGALCAALVEHDYEQVADRDINNPDPQLRMRPLLGVHILEGLRRLRNGVWGNGALYDPRTGRTYSSKLKLLDHNRVKITGCIGPGLCKGYVWTRVMRRAAAAAPAHQ